MSGRCTKFRTIVSVSVHQDIKGSHKIQQKVARMKGFYSILSPCLVKISAVSMKN